MVLHCCDLCKACHAASCMALAMHPLPFAPASSRMPTVMALIVLAPGCPGLRVKPTTSGQSSRDQTSRWLASGLQITPGPHLPDAAAGCACSSLGAHLLLRRQTHIGKYLRVRLQVDAAIAPWFLRQKFSKKKNPKNFQGLRNATRYTEIAGGVTL